MTKQTFINYDDKKIQKGKLLKDWGLKIYNRCKTINCYQAIDAETHKVIKDLLFAVAESDSQKELGKTIIEKARWENKNDADCYMLLPLTLKKNPRR